VVCCSGAGVASRLPLKLELSILFAKFLVLAFQAYGFVQQGLEVWGCVTLQLIVEWPYQTFQEAILSLRISVHVIWCVTGQLSELVPVLANCHVALLQSQKLLLFEQLGCGVSES
jgi:hypothetical protein